MDSSTLDLYAVLIQKEDSQFVHVDSVKWHRRSPDKYFKYSSTYTTGFIQDTVAPVYEFFFDTPHFVHDSFYVGFRSDYVRSPNYDPSIFIYNPYPQQWAWDIQGMVVQVPDNPSENFYETYFRTWYNEGWVVNRLGHSPLYRSVTLWGGIFPIIVPPDTDAVVGLPVWGFHRGEDYDGWPVFEWSRTEGQELYEVAYGRADQDPHDYHVVGTTYPWLILRDSTLDSTVVYAAQCRSRHHHACAIHDTLVWSGWTDTVEFYTGRYRPGSAPTEAIAEAVGGTSFTLSPNPARESVRCEVDAEGFRGGVLIVADAAGREVMRKELKTSERVSELRVAVLPAGTYFVTLTTKESSSTQKLIVE
ncbi:MAG: T9SS type A sorting domain-containing protein [Bacteroidales bacterium]|nr:T9SS type A sorting domain-containing protein [Bacteroidales bacterium]